MKRVEIIANQSIEEDIFEALEKEGLASAFTKIPGVHGNGNTTPKRGDHIWPEENFYLLLFGSDESAQAIIEVIKAMKVKFPDEGIKAFISENYGCS